MRLDDITVLGNGTEKRREPRTDPWETPKFRDKGNEMESARETKIVYELWVHKQSFNKLIMVELMRKTMENSNKTIRNSAILLK